MRAHDSRRVAESAREFQTKREREFELSTTISSSFGRDIYSSYFFFIVTKSIVSMFALTAFYLSQDLRLLK